MKKTALLSIILVSIAVITMTAETLWIHKSNKISLGLPINMAENITLSEDGATVNLNLKNNAGSYSYAYNDIKNVTFGNSQKIVNIVFNENDTEISNPFAFQGVSIEKNEGNITITSKSTENIVYELSGTTQNGSLTIVSDSQITLVLNNANITNTEGSAINIASAVDAIIELPENSVSSICDGNNGENGCLFSKGAFTFKGNGTLNVKGNTKHAIASKKAITIESGNINILSAVSDGIHTNSNLAINGGYIKTRSTNGDGIDGGEGTIEINNGIIDIDINVADTKGIKSDGDIVINGGDIQINMTADQGKAFKTKSNMTINGGTIVTTASGNVVVTDNDPSYCTVIKTDGDFNMSNGSIEITSSGEAGKGFSIDGNAKFSGGNVKITVSGGGATYTDVDGNIDSYSATCIKVDGKLEIVNGTFELLSTGIGGKCISTDNDAIFGDSLQGPTITAKTTGARFVEIQGTNEENTDYANPKVIKADNNLTVYNGTFNITSTQNGGEGLESKNIMTINGGTIIINTVDDCINAKNSIIINDGKIRCVSTGNDAIDSNGTLVINGGWVIASGAQTPECGFDCDNNANFTITGGIIVGIGGGNNKPNTANAKQGVIEYSGTITTITLTDANGNHILTFTNPQESIGGGMPGGMMGRPGGGPGGGGPGGGGPGGNGGGTSVLISTPDLTTGNSYSIYTEGSVTSGNTFEDLVYKGSYSAGTLSNTFTLSSIVSTVR